MCIHLTITPLDSRSGRMDADELAAASGLGVFEEERGWTLTPRGECGCGFAEGDAATGAHWRVRRDLQRPLIAAVEFAAKRVNRFRLQATWMGDPAATELTVTVRELSNRIAESVIANHAFIVRAG